MTTQDWLPWGTTSPSTGRMMPVIGSLRDEQPTPERSKRRDPAAEQWMQAFPVGPDNAPLFLTEDARQVLNGLAADLNDGRRLLCLVGPAGVGKTTLLRQIRNQFSWAMVGEVSQPSLGNLFPRLADSLRLRVGNDNGADLRIALQHLFATAPSRHVLLIVDDAETLKPQELDRLLDLLDGGRAQLLLVGQTELLSLFSNEATALMMREQERVYEIEPLSLAETGDYIYHRLDAAGLDPEVIAPDAVAAIHEYCGGLPRLINLLCFNAFVDLGFSSGRYLRADHVHAAALQRLQSGSYPFLSVPPASASHSRQHLEEEDEGNGIPPRMETGSPSVAADPVEPPLVAARYEPAVVAEERRPRVAPAATQPPPETAPPKEEYIPIASAAQRRDAPRPSRAPEPVAASGGRRSNGRSRYEPVLWLERDEMGLPPYSFKAPKRRRGVYVAAAGAGLMAAGVVLGLSLFGTSPVERLAASLGLGGQQAMVAAVPDSAPIERSEAPVAQESAAAPVAESMSEAPAAMTASAAAEAQVEVESPAGAQTPPALATPEAPVTAPAEDERTLAALAAGEPPFAAAPLAPEAPPAQNVKAAKVGPDGEAAEHLSRAQREYLARLYADRAAYERDQGRLSDAEATIRQGLKLMPGDARLRELAREVTMVRGMRQADARTPAERPKAREETLHAGAANPAAQPELTRLYLQRAKYEWQNQRLRDALVSIGYGLEGDPHNMALLDMRQKVLAELDKRD